MLYDPKWEIEVKADPLSLEGLIAWLEKQPADMTYDWHDCKGACLVGIYFASIGHPWSAVSYVRFTNYDTRTHVAGTEPFTFGAALARARKALPH